MRVLRDDILVDEIEQGVRKIKGIFLPDDNAKSSGIRPRWCRVCAVGPKQTQVQVGKWLLVEHGQWTRGITVDNRPVRKINPDAILLMADDPPEGYEWQVPL